MSLPELLSEVDLLKSDIEALRPINKELEQRIMQKFRLDWNFHSNNIEGNSLTYGETKTFLLHGLTAQGKPLKDHLDIKGHNEGIYALEDIIKNRRPLTETFIRGLHEVILPETYETPAITAEGLPTRKKITPGKYKTQPNHVKTATDETFFFASPEETPAEMENLLKWYNTVIEDPNTHPLIIASEFHYRFVRIHSFDDGNGRMARLLMNLVFMMKGFPPAVIKTEKKEEYHRALRQADGDNVDFFVEYIGEQLTRSLNLFLKGANGENIEEPGDFEKRFTLLKKELEPKILKKSKENETIKNIVAFVLSPFLEQLDKKLLQLQELFVSSESGLLTIMRNTFTADQLICMPTNNMSETIQGLKSRDGEDEFDYCTYIRFSKFKADGHHFTFSILLPIHFYDFKWNIDMLLYNDLTFKESGQAIINSRNFEPFAPPLAKLSLTKVKYDIIDEYTTGALIEHWVNQVSNKVLEFVEQKIHP
ncbi:MAG: Fic family protein [Bacteroidia bacterium]